MILAANSMRYDRSDSFHFLLWTTIMFSFHLKENWDLVLVKCRGIDLHFLFSNWMESGVYFLEDDMQTYPTPKWPNWPFGSKRYVCKIIFRFFSFNKMFISSFCFLLRTHIFFSTQKISVSSGFVQTRIRICIRFRIF